jgi:hypothetical protein
MCLNFTKALAIVTKSLRNNLSTDEATLRKLSALRGWDHKVPVYYELEARNMQYAVGGGTSSVDCPSVRELAKSELGRRGISFP